MPGRHAKEWRGIYRWTPLDWTVVMLSLAAVVIDLMGLLT